MSTWDKYGWIVMSVLVLAMAGGFVSMLFAIIPAEMRPYRPFGQGTEISANEYRAVVKNAWQLSDQDRATVLAFLEDDKITVAERDKIALMAEANGRRDAKVSLRRICGGEPWP
jgi:hypothetical protein